MAIVATGCSTETICFLLRGAAVVDRVAIMCTYTVFLRVSVRLAPWSGLRFANDVRATVVLSVVY